MPPSSDRCACGYERQANGNCPSLDSDSFAVQCVGSWAREKYDYLRRYVEATHAARARYLPPRGRGGAGFIDLFSGPGRVRIRETAEALDGSPLIALAHQAAPFSKLVFCDTDDDNVRALRARCSGHAGRVTVIHDDCNAAIDRVVSAVPKYGLNVAFIDPFGAKPLRWTTTEKLARIKRVDLLYHFPTGTLKRNFDQPGFDATIDEMLGTAEWRTAVRQARDVAKLIDVFRTQLARLGYDGEKVRSEAIKNSKGVVMYHLVFASKDPLGSKIWQSITRTTAKGQRGFDF